MERPNRNTRNNSNEQSYSWKVLRANKTGSGAVYFDLAINGIIVHGCRVHSRADGSGEFFSWPSYKGSDGGWYNHVYARLSDGTIEQILDAVYDAL